eukprot:NODE_117_length_18986_cov_0.639540.p7 type:complete len:243 gc:universal NODE_117_length_18986_cov_0.639540:8297-9025(+)
MKQFRIGGVPERFFDAISDQLTVCRGGTGQMIEMLEKKELDISIGLTEGFIKNGKFPIVGQFTVNPITWMICGKRDIKKLGISRFGSGSHLMGHLLMERDSLNFSFHECLDIDGLLKNLRSGLIDAFLWEYYTTLPYVEPCEIAGTIPSPWPAFFIACHPDILAVKSDKEDLRKLLNSWNIKNLKFYNENKEKKEFREVSYPKDHNLLDFEALEDCSKTLKRLGLIPIDHEYKVEQLLNFAK